MTTVRVIFPPALIAFMLLSFIYYLEATKKEREATGTIIAIIILILAIAGVVIIFYSTSGIAFDTIFGIIYVPAWLKWVVLPGMYIFQFLALLIYPLPLVFLYYGIKGIGVIIKKFNKK